MVDSFLRLSKTTVSHIFYRVYCQKQRDSFQFLCNLHRIKSISQGSVPIIQTARTRLLATRFITASTHRYKAYATFYCLNT
jgi:hypothetical protein